MLQLLSLVNTTNNCSTAASHGPPVREERLVLVMATKTPVVRLERSAEERTKYPDRETVPAST